MVTQTDGTTTETLTWDGSVVTAIDTAAPVLDPFDAVVEEDDLSFLHDPDGELAEVQDASGVLRSILRDPEGRPLAQRDASGDERLTFYGLSHGSLPLDVVTEDGEVITEIVVEGVRFGQQRSGEAKPTSIVTDPRGAVLQLGGETLPAFGAFGENTQGPSANDERHLFAGLESIPEAPGVMLAQHRAYHPRTGRFLSPDPLGLAGGMFRTRYAEGDGVNLVDPTGWSAKGLSEPDTMDYKEDLPDPGPDDSPSRDDDGEGKSFCSENAFACGGNDAGGGDVLRKMLILRQDGEEAEGEVDATSRRDERRERREAHGGWIRRLGTPKVDEYIVQVPPTESYRLGEEVHVVGRAPGFLRGFIIELGHSDRANWDLRRWADKTLDRVAARLDRVAGAMATGAAGWQELADVTSHFVQGFGDQLASDLAFGVMDPLLDARSQEYRSEGYDWGRFSGAAYATTLGAAEVAEGIVIGAGGPTVAVLAAPQSGGGSLTLAPAAVGVGAGLYTHGALVIGSRVERGMPDVPNYNLAKSTGTGASTVEPGRWGAGSFDNAADSLGSHFAKHGAEVGAADAAQSLRKAEEFSRSLRGARSFPVEGATEGVTRYIKNGRYIDLAPDGSIISFGVQ